MSVPAAAAPLPKGFSFEIPDLVMLQRWAESHGMRLVVELDHAVEGDEYEEVLAFYPIDSALRCWSLWRSADHFVLVPMNGPVWRCARLPDLLTELQPLRP